VKRIGIAAAAILLAAGGGAQPNGMVILLTDYGADSIYIGVLKGAIYTKFPEAKVDSITNSIPAFDIVAGAYILAEACREFPAGTTFCCIVDPGVGTSRKCIVLETKTGQRFVAPDNGLLSLVAKRDGVIRLREASNRALWRAGIKSSTFHGRDIFGPVAAALARGVPIEEVGPELPEMVQLTISGSRIENGVAYGSVVRVDSYGNLITSITAGDLDALGAKPGDPMKITVGETAFTAPYVSAYADVAEGEKLLLIQSMGLVECAVNKGNLADSLGAVLHADVTIRKNP